MILFRLLAILFVFELWIEEIESQLGGFDYVAYKKYLKKEQKKEIPPDKPMHKHKDTEEFVKRLEYNVDVKDGANSLDFGLTPIDLNLLQDEEFAEDVVEGVNEEFVAIDQEFGESGNSSVTIDKINANGAISLMHQGMYTPSPEYNILIDGLIKNVQQDLKKREMDPLYFGIHNRGIVRHSTKSKEPLQEHILNVASQGAFNDNDNNNNSSLPLGVGIIKGLTKLKRFGNAESRKDGDVTLVRSHYFLGPLDVELLFGSARGIHILNTTLSSLAAHALLQVSDLNNSTILKEFMTDSPMEYEIRLRGTKNRRFRNLSQSSISRLFKRGGRMEKRLERSFQRGLRKPIITTDINEKNEKNKKIDNKIKKERLPRRKA